MAEIASAYVSILPSAKGFGAKLDSQVSGDVDQSGKKSGLSFGKLFAAGAALGLGAKAFSFLGDSLAEATEAAVVNSRTENVIAKMGNAANVSAVQVANLAAAISSKTGIDDEAIQSGQNLLLTFGNIRNEAGKGNDIFNQTSKLMVDMSAAMGTDAKGSAIQLGKALNDPIKGLSSLSRVGVSFTEQQKAQITALTESGNVMGAQKIILGELEKQFGGAAASMTTPAEKAKVAWGNLQEQFGTLILPIFNSFATLVSTQVVPAISSFVAGIQSGTGAGGLFAQVFGAVAATLGRVAGFVVSNRDTIGTFIAVVGTAILVTKAWQAAQATLNLVMAANPIGVVIVAIAGLAAGIVFAYNRSETFRELVDKLWASIKTATSFVVEMSSKLSGLLSAAFSTAIGWSRNFIAVLVSAGRSIVDRIGDIGAFVTALRERFADAVEFVRGIPGKVSNALSSLTSTVREIFDGAMTAGKDKVTNIGATIIGWIDGIPGRLLEKLQSFRNAGASLIGGFVDGMKNAAGVIEGIASNVWDTVRGLLNGAIAKINAALSFTISLPGKDISINPPDIPALASGGVLTRPTLFLGGEGGESEAVLPLSKLTAMLDRERAAGRSADDTASRSGATYQFYTFDLEAALREAQRREAFAGAS